MMVETQTDTKTARRVKCPTCGKQAKQVSTVTLGALLNDEFAGQFEKNGQSCCNSTGNGCQP